MYSPQCNFKLNLWKFFLKKFHIFSEAHLAMMTHLKEHNIKYHSAPPGAWFMLNQWKVKSVNLTSYIYMFIEEDKAPNIFGNLADTGVC